MHAPESQLPKVNEKLLKVSVNIKKCTNVSGRALHLCKKAHCIKTVIALANKQGQSQSYTFEPLTTLFVPCACFDICFQTF